MKIAGLIFVFFTLTISPLQAKLSVKRVIDGDTLVLSTDEKVRLIGIDAPEFHKSHKLFRDSARTGNDIKTIKELGRRSFAFVKSIISGKEIELEFEQRKRDRYGRLLAYVWFYLDEPICEYEDYLLKTGKVKKSSQKTMLNALIVQCGFASVYSRYPFRYMNDFRLYEKEARRMELGLWNRIEGLKEVRK